MHALLKHRYYAVGSKHYKNLVTHFSENGLIPRRHGNTKCLPSNTVLFTQGIVEFILNYATIHRLPLPGRVPAIYSDVASSFTHDQTVCVQGVLSVHRQPCYIVGGNLRACGLSWYHIFQL